MPDGYHLASTGIEQIDIAFLSAYAQDRALRAAWARVNEHARQLDNRRDAPAVVEAASSPLAPRRARRSRARSARGSAPRSSGTI